MKRTGGEYDSGCSLYEVRKEAAKNALVALTRYRRVMLMQDCKDLRGFVLDAGLACLREDVDSFE